MSKKRILFLLTGILGTALLTGCDCSNDAVSVYEVLLDSPVGHVVVSSLNPTFEWHGSDTCEPDSFNLWIHENVPYNSYHSSRDVEGGSTSYTLAGSSLLPGREYYWFMQAENDYEPGDSSDRDGPRSDQGYFYTGPACSAGQLIAPTLLIPRDPSGNEEYDNWITHSGPQDFHWSYSGGCLPESYDYQFATDPGFTDIVLSGTTTELYSMHLYETFPNCSSLFWRVAANDGNSVGPWSDTWQFHWVEGDTCYQTHYISDDAARIDVRLYDDICDSTQYNFPASARTPEGCTRENNSSFVHGNGEYSYPPDHVMYGYRVELGAGPCPSAGLDSRVFGGLQHFYVIAPGTYCVSITREQTADSWGKTKDLTDGIWTDPLTTDTVAGKTIELGPGIQDVVVEFGWDEWDQVFLPLPIPENIHCRVGPEPICDPLKVVMEGEILPLTARDQTTEWKMASYQGETCFVYLPAVQIDEAMSQISESTLVTADLPFFDPPPPCPTPTPEPDINCSSFSDQDPCEKAGCKWIVSHLRSSYCTAK